MAAKSDYSMSLKALVDKESNKIIFIESGNELIDILFSFLTIPMGTIIRIGRSHSVPLGIGCMLNLYSSAENIGGQYFRDEVCRTMLLHPYSAAQSRFTNLKLRIDDNESTQYYLCAAPNCTMKNKLLSQYKGAPCTCGSFFTRSLPLTDPKKDQDDDEAFVKVQTRLILSDDLRMMPPLSASSFPLFTTLGISNGNSVEEVTCTIGVDEVLKLLTLSFISRAPLTETLLKNEPEPLIKGNLLPGICIEPQMVGDTEIDQERKISIKLMVSKSKKMVCYAEAGEDFVNLLFSFLTIPLGFVLKHIGNCYSKGCIHELYKSVKDLDDQYLKSNDLKEILLTPKLYPGFCYDNLLGIEEGSEGSYYYGKWKSKEYLTTYTFKCPETGSTAVQLKLKDNQFDQLGFFKVPMMFTVTDSLVISPVSPILAVSVMNELKVPFSDIKEEVVQVGKEEALCLLVASFLCDSPLTNVFMRTPIKQVH